MTSTPPTPDQSPAAQPASAASPKPALAGAAKALASLSTALAFAVAVILIFGGFTQSPISWTLVSIQLLPLMAAAFAIATIRGCNAASPSLALLCAAGTMLAAAGLSHLSSGPVVALNQPMRTWSAAMIAASGFMTLSAALAGLGNNPAARARALRGVFWAVPLVCLVAMVITPPGQALAAKLGGLPSAVRIAGMCLAALVAAFSLCVSLELLVTAFQQASRSSKNTA